MAAIPSPEGTKNRLVYDMQNSSNRFGLPGKLVRREGQSKTDDDAVDEAYDFAGDTYDFYNEAFNRNSVDNRGMSLISTVHFGRDFNNAFWNGEQMTYGDGDGQIFIRFTKSPDVVGHELTHGVVQHTANLVYENEPGALNEHFADVMGSLMEQWKKKQSADQADWYIGREIMAPSLGVPGLRTFLNQKAFVDNPILGTDNQPKHMDNKYMGDKDNGGVHWNSGIPNHVFYLVATELGGYAWDVAGQIWYRTLLSLNQFSQFQEAAEITWDIADRRYGPEVSRVVKAAWDRVGIRI
jgi:Zn-dependent metalloprotease